ncbi:MAG: hypothetical protein IKE94_10755 [Aeriscardovia sp.]|nr:hypothetical protein [Aeriscardovia sp.]
MGMTINEYMAQLKKLKSFHNGSYGASINFALDIIRKYQKIEEIINNAKDSDGAVKYNWLYEQISGVMEDGTD